MTDSSQPRVDELVEQIDAAYATGAWHSLHGNLADVPDEAWDWLPANGKRTIRQLISHLARCKIMYENFGFGDRNLDWDDVGPPDPNDNAAVLTWLQEAQETWRASVARLSDADLDRESQAPWREEKGVRWLITTMIHHDVYHAGEINHLRALYMGNDDWPRYD